MKLPAFALAAALALAGSGAFAATTKDTHVVKVGPNGGVTHVHKRVERDGNTRHVTRVVHKTTTPRHAVRHAANVVRHDSHRLAHQMRHDTRRAAHAVRHDSHRVAAKLNRHQKYAFVRHDRVHYAASPRPARNRHHA